MITRKASIAPHTIDQLYELPTKQNFKSVIAGLKAEIVALQEDKVNLVVCYIDIYMLYIQGYRDHWSLL